MFELGCILAIAVLAFPVGTFIVWPGWKKSTGAGVATILAISTTLFFMIIHPFVFSTLVGTDGTLYRWTHYTFWYVIVPTMVGSLFNPLPAHEFTSPWRLFCYVYAAFASAQILLLQYFWDCRDDKFLDSVKIALVGLPWFLSILSATSAWSIRRVVNR